MSRLLRTSMAALVASGCLAAPANGQSTIQSSVSRPTTDAQEPAAGPRRDPFARPITEGAGIPQGSAAEPVPRLEGVAGLSNDQIAVRGVLISDGRRLALVQGQDRKHYVIRPGDRLRDGVVQDVGWGGLVIVPNPPPPVGDDASGPPRKPRPFAGEHQ